MALCDDFDFESSPLERWTRQQFDVLGSSGYSLTAESPPHSFSIHMPSLTANSYFIEALEKDVAPAASASALSFSFSLEPSFPWEDAGEGGVTGDGFMLIANLSQGPGAPRTALSMDVEPTGTSLREQLTSADGGTSFPPPQYTSSVPQAGRWTHVVIDVDFASATATLSLDGAKVVTLALSGAWSASAATTVYLGDWYIHSTPSFELRYDNVIIRQR